MKRYFNLIAMILLSSLLFSQSTSGTQIGNTVIVPKCQLESGTQTDFYTVLSFQVGKPIKTIGHYLTKTGVQFIPSQNNPDAFIVSGGCIVPEKFCIKEYIIDGTQSGNSQPSVNDSSSPYIGNTIEIDDSFRSLSWSWHTGTLVDPGDGSISKLVLNGFEYYPTNSNFNLNGYSYSGMKDQFISSDWTLLAVGGAKVKVVVVSTNCE